jgi:hypothetical protein
MSRALTRGEIKVLFRQLVKACGGVEAVARELGCTHQWVSALQSARKPSMPDFEQILRLEVIAESAIITGAAAKAVAGDEAREVSAAVVGAVGAASRALQLAHVMDADGHRAEGERRAFQHAARENFERAQDLLGAAAALSAGD